MRAMKRTYFNKDYLIKEIALKKSLKIFSLPRISNKNSWKIRKCFTKFVDTLNKIFNNLIYLIEYFLFAKLLSNEYFCNEKYSLDKS